MTLYTKSFCSRFQELVAVLPAQVKSDRYCLHLLESLKGIAEFMYSVGPYRMSKEKLIQVLATLKPWELQIPSIEAAVKVSRDCLN